MPEEGVILNSSVDDLPHEYLMRRSHNPNDAQVPGCVIREWKCPDCGDIVKDSRVEPRYPYRNVPPSCRSSEHSEHAFDDYPNGPEMTPYAIDVPLLKTDGSRWS